MRASRLLSILLLLQGRGRMTATELARELEVSVRTIYRDVESLGMAGVPIYADHGPTGGYQLIGGYRTQLTGLSGDEAEALFLAGMPSAAAELGLGATLASAQLKLLAALPPAIRASAERMRERLYLDAPAWFQNIDETPFLAAVAEALWRQNLLRVRYLRAGRAGERQRTLAPLGLTLKSGVWYLVAQAKDTEPPLTEAPAGDGLRVYRVSRILELTTLQERFERPADFDLAAYWQDWSADFERRLYRGEAVVRLSPRIFSALEKYISPYMARAAAESAGPPDADGWREVTIPTESLEFTVADMLRLGSEVEVLSPPALRARMAEIVAALAARYLTDVASRSLSDRDARTHAQREEREQRRDDEIVGQ